MWGLPLRHRRSHRSSQAWSTLRSSALALALALAGFALGGCKAKPRPKAEGPLIKVVRVQNPSDDRSGAEHCASDGTSCRPLAPGQEISRSGLVRTFAGSSVTLDLGHGRRMDLGPLSETKLSAEAAELTRGDIGVVGTPLIAKEPASNLDFVVGRRTFQLDRARGALAHFAVTGDATGVTLRQGQLTGPDVQSLSAGESMRLTSAGAFRTSPSGGELSPLPYIGSQRREFGELWPEVTGGASRGLGTMTGRIPNTQQVLGGVRLAKHKVEVTIVDGLARTEVIEEFENQGQQILEGRFRFPVPSDAAVSRLGLWVGDQLVEGEVVEAKRARAIYESIVDRPVPRDPALLEWVTAGEMSLKVFPILPKNSRRVLLAYDQVLPVEGGRFRYSYPLSLGEGRDNLISELSIAVHVLDTAGSVQGLRVPSHEARLGREGAWTSAYYEERDVRAGRDFVVVGERLGGTFLALDLPSGAPPAAPTGGALSGHGRTTADAPGSGHFALRASVDLPPSMERPAAVRADRALVLDVSYSQSRETIRAQAALALAVVSELEPEEGFVLLACDSACAVHSARPGPTEERRQRAHAFLAGLSPGGASDLAGALVAGTLELRRLSGGAGSKGRQLVLLSDGQASAGELSAAAIARVASQHLVPEGVDLRLVGVGRKLDHGRLENLAIELDAALELLPSAVLLEQRIFEIAIGLRQPVVRGARVSLPPGLTLAGGSRLPALRLGQEVVLTGEITPSAAGSVELSGRLAGADYHLSVPLAAERARTTRSPFVSALFARQRIESLLSAENPDQHKAEIVRLSTAHRTMSPYTSFLVLENDEMFQRFGVERSKLDAEETASFDERKVAARGMADKDALSRELEQAEVESKAEEFASARTRASGGASAPASAPAPSSAPKPSSAPPPSKSKKAPMDFGDSWTTGASEGRRAEPNDPLAGDLGPSRDDMPGAWAPHLKWRPARAHLATFAADDVWRTWAAAELERVRVALESAPESRSRLEDFVRRHLAQGRFAEAAEVARRFVELDPDYLLAQDLLSQAAVVAGDHELARRMLDVQVETSPASAPLHLQAARAFESAGDGTRACAHYRTLAELPFPELSFAGITAAEPGLTQAAVKERARTCWGWLLGTAPGASAPPFPRPGEKPSEKVAPQLRVEVTCEPPTSPGDCPAPIVVGPDGRVTSPWTPGLGASTQASVGLQKLRTGTYFVLVLGGAPGARGQVALIGRYERTSFAFVAGGLRTVARSEVNFY